MENVVATIGSNALNVVECTENVLAEETGLIEVRTQNAAIASDDDYVAVVELVKNVKRLQKQVVGYWEPLRISAKATYDDVLQRKKEMLVPLENAEKTLKSKIADYLMEKERKRKAQEDVLRKLVKQEMERKLIAAVEAEAAGDVAGAEYAMAEAETMENVSIVGGVKGHMPKAVGVSQSKAWRIIGIDSAKVPNYFSGTEIRPVDKNAIKKLIKESNGTIQIPGVMYEETASISVRGVGRFGGGELQ